MALWNLDATIASMVTPDDDNDILLPNAEGDDLTARTHRGCYLYVGGTGNADVITAGGNTVSFVAVPAGTLLPVRIKRLLETSTATLMVAIW